MTVLVLFLCVEQAPICNWISGRLPERNRRRQSAAFVSPLGGYDGTRAIPTSHAPRGHDHRRNGDDDDNDDDVDGKFCGSLATAEESGNTWPRDTFPESRSPKQCQSLCHVPPCDLSVFDCRHHHLPRIFRSAEETKCTEFFVLCLCVCLLQELHFFVCISSPCSCSLCCCRVICLAVHFAFLFSVIKSLYL